ncbi:histidine--tRNA ligase [Humibacter ginsenosidimutans]|uniref:Histidyl-tRNA synthetase n=1 Tax=Humibacter ginsenosidimutans TaxID=2599293 RepID=A0A5B8M4C0_9MICO|nr:ATP phosphoribosyltransferase regulatory subunit [Humibacter ginsenosidimutans]QDZ14440.1 histidine--tRNA ligase [Humibacter ginsenosidimutans]
MAQPVNPPRGMRDFLPADKARREHALGVIRQSYTAQGFDEIETPVMEDAARLHSGLGGDNEKLAFGILRRGLNAEAVAELAHAGDLEALTDLGLRFDLTVPLARFYATHRAALPGVFKSIQIAPVWRAERPQKGRYRQFVQCDIDIIGEQGVIAEIELITSTIAALSALGLTGCAIRINHRAILRGLIGSWGVPEADYERAMITIDKEDKIGVEGVVVELVDLGLLDADRSAAATEDLAGLPDDGWGLLDGETAPRWLDADAYRQLHDIRDAVAAVAPEVPLVFSHNLVRGMGYYTGAIFEIQHPEFGFSLGGGGRYDGMIGRFLGSDVPAVGFSLGFERIVDLVDVPEGDAAGATVLVYDRDVDPATLFRLKTQLVDAGARVRIERRVKNLKPLLERLSEAGYTRFATVTAQTEDVAQLQFRDLA